MMSRRTGRLLAVAAILALVTVSTFARVLRGGFLTTFDDQVYVLENRWVGQGLTAESVRWAFTNADAAFWHPITWLSHMADVELYGLDPVGHHLSAVLLHAAAAAALFVVLQAMTGAIWRSALVAALFALHPLHVESVAWVSERKDVLCALFWFLGMGAYLWYVRRPGPARLLVVVAAFAASLMSKTMAVTFPFALLLVDYWPLGRLRLGEGGAARAVPAGRASRVWVEKLPLFALIPVIAAVSYTAQVRYGAVDHWLENPLWIRASNASISYGAYLVKTLIPTGLAVYYPHPGPAVSVPLALFSGATLLLLTVWSVRRARRHPSAAFGWLWYLGTLVPVIGLVEVGQFARADRYTYLPLVGVFVAAVWGATSLAERLKAGVVLRGVAAAAVVLACAAASWAQTGYWLDEITLWTRTLAVTGDNVHARINLGVAWKNRREPERAAEQFREAIRLNGNLTPVMHLLADVLDDLGRRDEAAAQRARARELDVAFRAGREVPAPATGGGTQAAFGPRDHNNAGVGAALANKFDEAEAHFRKALELDPGYVGARYNLANLYRDQGRLDAAEAEYLKTTALDPRFAMAHVNLGILLQRRGDLRGAAAAYRRALEVAPGLEAARTGLETIPAGSR